MKRLVTKPGFSASAFFFLVALFFLYMSIALSRETAALTSLNSPAFFPAVLAVLLGLFSFSEMLSRLGKPQGSENAGRIAPFRWRGFKSDVVVASIITVYILLLPFAGFFLMTVFLMLSIMLHTGEKKALKLFIYPLFTAILMYYMAVKPFNTPIPFLPWD